MFALAYLAAVRKDAIGGVDLMNLAAELLPLTVPEVRRLLWALVSPRLPPPRTVLHWAAWRRKHQQRARRAHWRRRTQRTQVKPGCSIRANTTSYFHAIAAPLPFLPGGIAALCVFGEVNHDR